ncbi:Transmembrane amino acid transporter protein [Musa troglodytarum]|uniref:Transmembrane amino acid transporter protein n=1 Tax=Musa troglodytarum TaxID=320322 RepID=A0A9E7K316_9LILI|nr:Transmembrane amino acid transporter protein [Musa troglodytarum]
MGSTSNGNEEKVVETVMVGRYVEMEQDGEEKTIKSRLSGLLWHGGSAYDAWFSCASNQVAQVLLTLPYSFSQLGMLSGILFQLFYGLMGSWTAYLISILYVEYRTRKEREKVDFRNHVIQWFEVLDGLLGKHWRHVGLAFNCTFLLFGSVIQLIACARIWSFLGLVMTTYTAWYLTIASLLHGQVEGVKHSGPTKLVLYFTGATNILYTFGGHAVTVEIMHAMWKPQKFKAIYLLATLYVLTLTLPSAASVYWAFGDALLNHSNAFSLLPRTAFRDAAVVLMLIHQFITFGFACTPLYFVWEKVIGLHDCRSLCKRAAARLPVVVPIWFLAIVFPFFGPINSAVGSLLVSFTVYVIPALAHMFTFRSAVARENAVERPPRLVGGWIGAYMMNMFVVGWVLVVGFGLGGWASMTNFIRQINTFGLFAKCYQCPPPMPTLAPTPFPSNAQNATNPGIIPSPSPAPSYFIHHQHYHHGRP